MRTTAIGNLKGGVGKTTVTINLAIALIRLLRRLNPTARIGVWDMDPQALCTALLTGRRPRDFKASVATLVAGLTDLDQTIVRLDEADWLDDETREVLAGIDLFPSNPTSILRADTADALWELRELIPELPLPQHTWMLFDCGYGDTDAFTMAAAAADEVIGVTSASEGGLLGLGELQIKLRKMSERMFPHVKLGGVIANDFDLRETAPRAILDNLRGELGELFWEPVIPRRAIVERSHGQRLPLAGMTVAASDRATQADLVDRFDQHAHHLVSLEGAAA